ncbi:MAG: 5'-nucleotidase [Xanthomonadales bacterium]|uniref:5'-nucleotidase n=1 Tax=Hydrogenophaga sp. TaxID=1904254 RepID=UPI0016B68510|nr:5'-nucleotidase [Hydrogenophaga sp.]NIM69828.1 5'-nucleotidase [Xanthomonadales bacterium]NIN32850.1 5'-nucleotidase [Hydrogenophaga sp.]NIN59184.1 5'-nucleotidase [Xanthomonadales bacterium]NIN74246.1 5'-nucleotidase [Xanthomonadales bacterium]NIO12483.1 5'-nucleotidase [Xanthomonadales bacterium]
MNSAEIHQLNAAPLVVAISSRALFDLSESHRVFEDRGLEDYAEYQVAHEADVLKPGVAFPLVKKLLALNEDAVEHPGVEIILMSRNSADTGLRIFNTIEHHGLRIERAVFTNGASPYRYMPAFGAHLFLSTHGEDVRRTLEAGFAAALILPGAANRPDSGQLRIAFDGDAVLFGDEAERIYQAEGLEAFARAEREAADTPLPAGPFKPVLSALHQIQSAYPIEDNPIRTALVTARSAPAHKRVILTLRSWGIRIDEALFLGGKPKGDFLKAFGADIFFDDQRGHCESAREHVATGHVPHGVMNE